MGALALRPRALESEAPALESEALECYIGPNGFVVFTNNNANCWVDLAGSVHDANNSNQEVGKVIVWTVRTPDGVEYTLHKCKNCYVCDSVDGDGMLYQINHSGDDIVFMPFEYNEHEHRLYAVTYRANCTNLQWLRSRFTMTLALYIALD